MDISKVSDFAERSGRRILRDGTKGAIESARDLYVSALRHAISEVYWPDGTPIFAEDWDVLVILNACRADMLAEVRDEYEFLDQPGTRYSVDSASQQWMEKNFSKQPAPDVGGTVYVTGNLYSDSVLDGPDFELLDEVWKDAWDDDLGRVRA